MLPREKNVVPTAVPGGRQHSGVGLVGRRGKVAVQAQSLMNVHISI